MKCDRCKKNEARIIVEGAGNYCLDCHNELMAENLGVEHTEDYIRQLTIIGNNSKHHTFEISRHIMPGYSKWDAVEAGGYSFSIMVSNDEPQQEGLRQLNEKVFEALSYRSLEEYDSKHIIGNALRVKGKQYGLKSIGTGLISYNNQDDEYGIIIDGKYMSFKEFGKMASTFEDFTMEYQFNDTTAETLAANMAYRKVDISKKAVTNRFDRYQQWLLNDDKLPPENENEYLQVMEECIDDLNLMVLAGFRTECKDVAVYMIIVLETVNTMSHELIDYLLKKIHKATWFLFQD